MRRSLVLLAGGQSRRMGRDKAGLPAPGGRTLLEWMVDRLQAAADEVIVAGGGEKLPRGGARWVRDAITDSGPLGGMLAGVRAARAPYIWVVACDLPEVSPRLGEVLFDAATGRDAAVPRLGGRVQGLCAVYASGIANRIEHFLQSGQRAVHGLVDQLDAVFLDEGELRTVDPGLRSLTNLNTPADHAHWLKAAGP